MFTHNRIKFFTKGCLVFLFLINELLYPLDTNQKTLTTLTTKGLEIKLIKNSNMNFIHAELNIFYRGKNTNPAIRHLTMLNLFDGDVNKSGSGLLSILRKMGNDFEIQQRPDYLLFKINFLDDKLAIFMQFLRSLYSYKAFSLKKFNYSLNKYWDLTLKEENWKKKAAFQVAYRKFFAGHPLGNTLIVSSLIKNINLAQIRSYYLRTYTLENSSLILKGNIKQAIAVGTFKRLFKSFKEQDRNIGDNEKLNINNRREVVIYHINSMSPPELFWFETIPPLTNKGHIPMRVLNDMLFAQPIGRISRARVSNGIKHLKIDTEVLNHKQVSMICNTVKLNVNDIEKFILAVDSEKRKLKKLNRREYLDVKNYFCGRIKVDSRRFENQVELERDFSIFNGGNDSPMVSFARVSQQVTYESLSAALPFLNGGTIVIVGNANLITRNLSVLKPRVIRYLQ
jgi:hypothetical protein